MSVSIELQEVAVLAIGEVVPYNIDPFLLLCARRQRAITNMTNVRDEELFGGLESCVD